MIYRLGYGFMIILLVAVFALLLSLKLLPYWQAKYRFEPVAVDGHSFAIAWASDDGKVDQVTNIPVAVPESFRFEFPYIDMQKQVEKSAVKVLVKAKLPETESYVLKLSGKDDTVTLPLARLDDGTWSTPEFIAMQADNTARYFHGVRVFHVHGEQCLMAVEKVVKL
jgi:hypothetical protein